MTGKANVLARMGDIFEGSADLTVLPCSGKGTVSSATKRWLQLFRLPSPKDLESFPTFGNISNLIPFTGPKTVTRHVVFAASVLNDHSSPEIITGIGNKLGKLTLENSDIRIIESPLLGTGSGGLSTEVAGRALCDGFRSTARPDALLYVFVFDKERQIVLENLFEYPAGRRKQISQDQVNDPSESTHASRIDQSVQITGDNNIVLQNANLKPRSDHTKGINWTKWGTIIAGLTLVATFLLANPDSEVPEPTTAPTSTDIGGVNGDELVENKLVFSAFDGKDYEVFVLNLETNKLLQITRNEYNDTEPSWSPDGDQILFSSNTNGNYDIYKINSDGSNLTMLTDHSSNDTDPTWSRITDQIAFVSKREGSPYHDIYIMNSDGTDQTNLTNNRSSDDTDPTWSPTSATLAFTSYRENFYYKAEVYLFDTTSTTNLPTAITNSTSNDRRPAWSPDGSSLLFETDRNGNWDIYSVSLLDSSMKNLTPDDNADQQAGTWSADGKQFAYISVESGSSETQLYIRNSDGSNPTNKTNNLNRPSYPDWWFGN